MYSLPTIFCKEKNMDNEMIIDLTNMLHGIRELTEGLTDSVYGATADGVLTKYKFSEIEQKNQYMNAEDFVRSNYELTAGAFRIIAAATNIITRAITNDELDLIGKEDGD